MNTQYQLYGTLEFGHSWLNLYVNLITSNSCLAIINYDKEQNDYDLLFTQVIQN